MPYSGRIFLIGKMPKKSRSLSGLESVAGVDDVLRCQSSVPVLSLAFRAGLPDDES